MKILDRYILMTFIKNYLISFMVLVGLYVALDMVFNFDDLVEAPKSAAASLGLLSILADIVNYYFYQCFVFFVHLSGMIAVVAAAFTLVRLSRFNELTAMLASGTPLLRMAMPIVVAGAVLNLLLLPIDQELLIPQMIPKLVRSHEDAHTVTPKSFPIQMMQDSHGALFSAAEYTATAPDSPATIQYLDVVERDKDLQPVAHLYADEADWDPAHHLWLLRHFEQTDPHNPQATLDPTRQLWLTPGGYRVPILRPEESHAQPQVAVDTYQSDITPDEIALYRGGDYVQLLATERINQLVQRPKSYGTNNLLRTKHLRFTQPLANVIMLLLAIPSVLTRDPTGLKTAALRCLVLCGLCMGSVFIAYQLAASPPSPLWTDSWPALMAWLPIFIFGPLSVWFLDRVKS